MTFATTNIQDLKNMTIERQSIHDRIMCRADGVQREGLRSNRGEDPSKPRVITFLPFFAGILFVAVGVAAGVYGWPLFQKAVAQAREEVEVAGSNKLGSKQISQEDNTAKTEQSDPQDNSDPFSTHSAQANLDVCSSTYVGLGKILTDGTEFMVQTQTAKSDANAHSVSGIVGMVYPPNSGAYSGPAAGLVFAAPTAHGCEGNLVRIVPFEQACSVAATLLPPKSEVLQPLSTLPVYNLPTGGQAMLMPTGTGCVAITIMKTAAKEP